MTTENISSHFAQTEAAALAATRMKPEELKRGARVQLRAENPGDPFLVGPIAAGALGTIIHADAEVVAVLLDQPVADLDEWGNCLEFYGAPLMDGDARENFLAEADPELSAAPPLVPSMVHQLFALKLGRYQGTDLPRMTLESPCGQDCRTVIDTAAAMLKASDPAVHDQIRAAANQAVAIFING